MPGFPAGLELLMYSGSGSFEIDIGNWE